jgi:hypothetical protein
VNQSVPVLTLKSQSCSIDIWTDIAEVTTVIQSPVDGYSFQFVLWGCNDGAPYEGLAPCDFGQSKITNDTALWLYFTVPQSDDSVGTFEFPQRNTDNSTTMVLQRYVAMACQPSITTSRGQATIKTDPSTGNILSEVTVQQATEIPALAANSSSLPLPAALLTQTYCSETPQLTGGVADPLLLANTTQDDLPSLGDPNVLSANLRTSISSTMAQAAKRYLMAHISGTVQGAVIKPDVRLVIQPVSFGIILAALCLAVINSLALLLMYTPCRVASLDPGSIGGLAAILARSRDASASFQGTGSLSEEKLSQLLIGEKYRAEI